MKGESIRGSFIEVLAVTIFARSLIFRVNKDFVFLNTFIIRFMLYFVDKGVDGHMTD